MAIYVDGFVIPIPKKNLAAYRKMARAACKIWMEHGALEYHECVGDDLKIPGMTSFLKGAKAKPSETVMFSWVSYKSKAHRDRCNAKIMTDPRIKKMMEKGCPFDMKRMMYGGFKSIADS